MKYVVIKYNVKDSFSKEEIILFPETLVHADFAEYCIQQYMMLDFNDVKVVSAGFCDAQAECYGKSETLNLESREKDSNLIFAMQYHLNIETL